MSSLHSHELVGNYLLCARYVSYAVKQNIKKTENSQNKIVLTRKIRKEHRIHDYISISSNEPKRKGNCYYSSAGYSRTLGIAVNKFDAKNLLICNQIHKKQDCAITPVSVTIINIHWQSKPNLLCSTFLH